MGSNPTLSASWSRDNLLYFPHYLFRHRSWLLCGLALTEAMVEERVVSGHDRSQAAFTTIHHSCDNLDRSSLLCYHHKRCIGV
ncbi:MAG TPA: hypothetical protein VGF67_26650 [Ktedonobacteraceae bacterium]